MYEVMWPKLTSNSRAACLGLPSVSSISVQYHTKLDPKQNFLTQRRTADVITNPLCFKK